MPEPILTKLAVHVIFLADNSTEPAQFLNFENCVQNTFLKLDFKAV
jgi:hypothetical protein